MSGIFERITVNPYTEGAENQPLELSAWYGGQGIFLDGATYEPGIEDVHLAQSVDTEGAAPVARTIKERPSPVIKIRIVEPSDPAATNFVFNPQVLVEPNSESESFAGDTSYLNSVGPSLESAQPVAAQEQIVDLNGFEYAAFVNTPLPVANEGVMWGGAGGNPNSHKKFLSEGVPGRTDGFPVEKQNVPYTGGVWMRGVAGGETVDLVLIELFNLIPDPSFEYDTTGAAPTLWEHKGFALTNFKVEGGGGLVGAKSLRASSTGAVGKTEKIEVLNKIGQSVVTPGTAYSASMVVENNKAEVAGVEVALQIKWSNGEVTSTGFTNLKAGIQTLKLENVQAPTTPTLEYAQICLVIRNESVGATEVDVNLDAALLCHGALPAYFDGDSAESRWLGTPGASYSWLGTKSSFVLTTSWRWYTVSRANWTTGTRCALLVRNPSATNQSWFVTGAAVVQAAELAEYFDGSWPGCSWEGAPWSSASTRPSPGGPRRDAIMADVEQVVTQISRTHSGTVRRTLPNGHQITFDLLNAQLQWDEQQFLRAGTAAGTIKFTSEPYGRSPEMTLHQDTFMYGRPQDYFMQAGLWSDFSFGKHEAAHLAGIRLAGNLAVEHVAIYTAGRYPLFSNETEIGGEVNTVATGMKWGAIVAWLNNQNYIEGYLTDDGTHTILKIDQVLEGKRANIASTNFGARITIKTRFTVRCRLQNDEVFCEYYPSEPKTYQGVEPTVTLSAKLIGGSFSYSPQPYPWNSLVPHLAGWTFTPQATNNTLSAFISNPYVFRNIQGGPLEFMVTEVPGSAPAFGRMIITNDGGFDQWWAAWGQVAGERVEINEEPEIEGGEETGVLVVEATSRGHFGQHSKAITVGPTGTTGAKQQAKNVIESTITASESLIQRFQPKILPGIYQVLARVYDEKTAEANFIRWRAVWGETVFGESGDLVTNAFASAAVHNDWCLVNLGQVNIPASSPPWVTNVGAPPHATEFGITASYDEGNHFAQGAGFLDVIYFIPIVDGSGVAEAVSSIQTNSDLYAYDGVTTTAGALKGVSLELGGTKWETAGTGADFVRNTGSKWIERTGEGDKLAWTSQAIGESYYVRAAISIAAMPGSAVQFGTIIIRKDETNWLGVFYSPTLERWEVVEDKAGVLTTLDTVKVGGSIPSAIAPQFVTVYATLDHEDRVAVWLWVRGNNYQGTAPAMSCHFNGERPLGPPMMGLFDNEGAVATARHWMEFSCGSIARDAAIIREGSLEIRSDQVNRTGLWPGAGTQAVSKYEGDYLRIPTMPGSGLGSRFFVRTCRNNPVTEPDTGLDPTSAFLSVTPRWANIPNA